MTNKYVKSINYSKYCLDKNFYIYDVDDNFESLTGYSKNDIKNLKINQVDLLPKEDKSAYLKELYRQAAKTGEAYVEHRLVKKDGTISYVYCLGNLLKDGTSIVRCCKIEDSMLSSEINKDFNRRISDLKEEARCDNLTGLLRREPYENSLNYYLGRKVNLSYMIVDVDNFKGVNDNYGHQFGDLVLVKISDILKKHVGNNGLVCRLGGDEFSITLLKIKSEKEVNATIKKIMNSINKLKFKCDKKTIDVTVSIGVVNLINYDEMIRYKDIYKFADLELYKSKDNGKNCFTVYK